MLFRSVVGARYPSAHHRRAYLQGLGHGSRPPLPPGPAEHGLALDVSVPSGPLVATADPDRLAQVVANLVENALKFASSRIAVAAAADEAGRVRIVVDDDGPGIAAEDQPHVFERLYTSARGGGSGLGLAIVAELVSAMGGTVAAVSPFSGGARFEVRLNG